MESKFIKTPLRYPGGKSKVSDYIVSLFPDYSEYREPFLGGGSVFLTALQNKPDAIYKINDLYTDLYSFWKTVCDENVGEPVKSLKLKYDLNGRDLYEYSLDRLNSNDICETERGILFFVMNRITFSGTSLSGGHSDESFRKRFTMSSINRLEDLCEFLKTKDNIELYNEDFSFLFEGVDEAETFMFLDPPYYGAESSALYGKNGDKHKGFEHERLKECLNGCSCKFLMTYDDCDYIRDLYKDYNIFPFEFSYGMRNVGKGNMKGKELLISNYDLKEKKDFALF